ncbi:RNA exonuclease 3 [Actinomortierella ambigua]|nr:RNA exonuclease 3 [Actinomortierella ambigua]
MLKSLGLFASIPCPSLPDCPRRGACLFSHHSLPTPAPSSSSVLSQAQDNPQQTESSSSSIPVRPPGHAGPSSNPSPSLGIKRKQPTTPASEDIPSSPASSRPLGSASNNNNSNTSSTSQNAVQVKRSKHDHMALSPSPSPQSRPTKPPDAVLLARPDTVTRPKLQQHSSSSSTSTSASPSSRLPSVNKGPPVLKIDLRSHSKPQLRQKVVTQFYEAFRQIYASLKDGDTLASEHAVAQESDVHKKTTQGTYKSLAAVTLQRLKKRPPSTGPDDVGIEGEWDPNKKTSSSLTEIWQLAKAYCPTKQQLQDHGYPVELPPALDPVPSPKGDKVRTFRCCDEPIGSKGCTSGPHVYKEDDLSLLHARIPFVETPDRSSAPAPHVVVAMDCEMCYTAGGFEMVRISVVSGDGQIILDELVKPGHPVVDLNTRFSGIKSLEDAKYTLDEVREKLFELIDSKTIIIGQSLDNDFKVLRLIHNTVIDTSMMFPHPRGDNFKFSLQFLAQEYLQRFIQDTEDGHDSFEDAKTCLDLVRFKVEKDHQQKST